MKNAAKLWLLVLLLGIVVHALGIAMFCSVSMSKWFRIGQPLAFGLTLLGAVLIAWFTLRNRNKPGTIISLGLVLSAGYLAAFHIVGLVAFPGLLRDVGVEGYWISVVRVFAAVALIHTALAAAVFGVTRTAWLRRPRRAT